MASSGGVTRYSRQWALRRYKLSISISIRDVYQIVCSERFEGDGREGVELVDLLHLPLFIYFFRKGWGSKPTAKNVSLLSVMSEQVPSFYQCFSYVPSEKSWLDVPSENLVFIVLLNHHARK